VSNKSRETDEQLHPWVASPYKVDGTLYDTRSTEQRAQNGLRGTRNRSEAIIRRAADASIIELKISMGLLIERGLIPKTRIIVDGHSRNIRLFFTAGETDIAGMCVNPDGKILHHFRIVDNPDKLRINTSDEVPDIGILSLAPKFIDSMERLNNQPKVATETDK